MPVLPRNSSVSSGLETGRMLGRDNSSDGEAPRPGRAQQRPVSGLPRRLPGGDRAHERLEGCWELAVRAEGTVCTSWEVRAWGLWELPLVLLGRDGDFGGIRTCCPCKAHTCTQRLVRGNPGLGHCLCAGAQGPAAPATGQTSHYMGSVSVHCPLPISLAHVPHRPRTRASPPSRRTRTTCAGRASCSSSYRPSPRAQPCAEDSRRVSTGNRSSWRS